MPNPPKQETEAHVTGSTSTSTQTSYPPFNPGPPSHPNQPYQNFSTCPTSSFNPNHGGFSVNVEQQLFDDAILYCDQYPNNGGLLLVNEEGTNNAYQEVGISGGDQDEEEHHIIGIKEDDYLDALPSGFRFEPHDDELISDYLNRKIHNQDLPHHRIKLVNLYGYTPYDLTALYPEMGENKWYFFTSRDRKYQNGSRPNRATGAGYWKATGKDKPVRKDGKDIGYRKALVFYDGKSKEGIKTNWIMHEYRVADPPVRIRTSEKDMRLDDYVLCKIIKKPERSRKNSSNDVAISDNSPDNLNQTDSPSEEVDQNGQLTDSPLESKQNGLAENNIQAPHPHSLASYPVGNEYYIQNSMNNQAGPQYAYYPRQNVFSNALQNGYNNAAERNIQFPQQMGIYPSGYMPDAFINPMERNIQVLQPKPEAIYPSSYMMDGMMNPMERNIQAPSYMQPGQLPIKTGRQMTSFDASGPVDYGLRSLDKFSSFEDWNFEDPNDQAN